MCVRVWFPDGRNKNTLCRNEHQLDEHTTHRQKYINHRRVLFTTNPPMLSQGYIIWCRMHLQPSPRGSTIRLPEDEKFCRLQLFLSSLPLHFEKRTGVGMCHLLAVSLRKSTLNTAWLQWGTTGGLWMIVELYGNYCVILPGHGICLCTSADPCASRGLCGWFLWTSSRWYRAMWTLHPTNFTMIFTIDTKPVDASGFKSGLRMLKIS